MKLVNKKRLVATFACAGLAALTIVVINAIGAGVVANETHRKVY